MRTIADSIADSVVVVTPDGLIEYVNPAAEALFERSGAELVGSEFGYPIAGCEIAIQGAANERKIGEMRVSEIDWQGRPAHLVVIRDVTERDRLRRLERRLLLANKRSAIAQLSARIAHEINNPTAFILANLTVMRDIIGDFEAIFAEARINRKLLDKYQISQSMADLRDMLDDNTLGLDRIRSFLREFKALSQDTLDGVEMVDINHVIELGCALVGERCVRGVELVRDLGKVPLIAGDHFKLTQMVVNLLENAVQAISDGKDASEVQGTVEVRSTGDGKSVIVTVRDTGSGIAEEHRDKIFEPFFIANLSHRGIGLGLPIAAEIISYHGGRIEVDSEVGKGSVFRCILPADTGLPLSEQQKLTAPGHVRARVLLIAEDPQVRSQIHHMLDAAHDVIEAGSMSALSHIARDSDYDVVLCDLASAAMSTMALYKTLSKQIPALAARMVFITGASPSAKIERFLETSRVMILERPLSITNLRELIERMSR